MNFKMTAAVGLIATMCLVTACAIERGGYVERVPDPGDGRARLVRIAERGARSVDASRRIVDKVEAEWTAHLGERRMAQLRRTLTDLREITDPWR